MNALTLLCQVFSRRLARSRNHRLCRSSVACHQQPLSSLRACDSAFFARLGPKPDTVVLTAETTQLMVDARAELEAYGEQPHSVVRFDWQRIERSKMQKGSLRLVFALPLALLIVAGAGIALGWTLRERVANEALPTYELANIASDAAKTQWEPLRARGIGDALQSKRGITEFPVFQHSYRRVLKPRAETTTVESDGRFRPMVIIVKPAAKLPPLFSPEAYRKRR